jgi:hypothetical protein
MDEHSLAVTRRSLHGVAELVLAGPRHRNGGGIRLRVVPGGFATVAWPGLRVDGHQLITSAGPLPLTGSYAEVAAAAGVKASRLYDVYSGGPKIQVHERIELDPAAARLLADAFVRGDAALQVLAPHEMPVLWPSISMSESPSTRSTTAYHPATPSFRSRTRTSAHGNHEQVTSGTPRSARPDR